MENELARASMVNGLMKPDPDPDPEITTPVRLAWNAYVKWLDKKGKRGKPELDKDGVGFTYLDQYIKENPTTALSRKHIRPIQREFTKVKESLLKDIKEGKIAKFGDGANEQNFMNNLSDDDGFPGQYTTSHSFPDAMFKDEKGTIIKKEFTLPDSSQMLRLRKEATKPKP